MRKSFRSTTAMMLALALSVPQGAFAQGIPEHLQKLVGQPDLPRVDGELQFCALSDPAPCILPDGTVAETEGDSAGVEYDDEDRTFANLVRDADLEADLSAAVEAQTEATPEAEAEEVKPEAGAEAATEAPAAEAEQPAEAQAEPAPDEPAAEAEAEAETQPEEPAADAQAEAEAEPEQPAAEAQAEAEAEPEQPAAEAQAEAEPEQPAAEAQAEAEVKPEAAPEAEATAETDAAQELRDRLAAEAEKAGGTAGAVAGAVADALGAGETTEARDDAGLTEESAQAEAERQAEQQQAAETVAAAGADAQAEGEVETETVAEDQVRRSDQDAAASAEASTTAAAAAKRDGLSPVETIALLGVGALIVGSLLKNGDEVVSTSNDRAVVQRPDGTVYVIKDDDTILRRPGSQVETRRFDDGSTITILKRQNGVEVRTVRDATGRVLRRTKVLPDGTSVELFDDTEEVEVVDVTTLPKAPAQEIELSSGADLEAALRREMDYDLDRRFSLGQVRSIRAVRELVPLIDLDSVTFDTGSAAIRASEADDLVTLGQAMQDLLDENPGEVFLIEGHTDAVGSAASNLTLSDRRAESLALALTEYFDIPPENMVIQGYGESYLKVPTLSSERENRRVAVRRITPLLTASAG